MKVVAQTLLYVRRLERYVQPGETVEIAERPQPDPETGRMPEDWNGEDVWSLVDLGAVAPLTDEQEAANAQDGIDSPEHYTGGLATGILGG